MSESQIWMTIRKKLISAVLTIVFTFGFFGIVTLALAEDCSTYTNQTECETQIDICEWNEEDSTCSEIPVEPEPVSNLEACENNTAQEDCELNESCNWNQESGLCIASVQMFGVNEVQIEDGWEPNALQTYGSKFLIRGKEALSWSLNIDDVGIDSEAIQTSYNRVLTIVNSLFILGLLAIAGMWMFSIIIPRRYLRQVIVVYAAAVIFVNFAMPLNRLFIDGTNLLQKTLLTTDEGSIEIANIVNTPAYEEAIGYITDEDLIENNENSAIQITTEDEEIEIGNLSTAEKEIEGNMINPDTDDSYNINLTIPKSTENSITLSANQEFTISKANTFNPNAEAGIFAFIMMLATGLAYFILALIFVLRVVILWALLILSPILFLLAIFRITRGWFWNWLSVYGKWLLIGPLTALGIAIVVNIWKTIGIPIESSYTEGVFYSVSNMFFYLPGSNTPNTLSTTPEMMEYFVFLMMLYIPIFFAFVLTRQKYINSAVSAFVEKGRQIRTKGTAQMEGRMEGEKEKEVKTEGVFAGMKDFVSSKIGRFTETAMPGTAKTGISERSGVIPSASNFLPEQLALTPLHNILELIGVNKESRKSRDTAITKLADPSSIFDGKERKNVSAVRNEIDKRASMGDPDAAILMNEIKSKETSSVKESKTSIRSTKIGTAPKEETAGKRPQSASEIHAGTKVQVEPKISVETGTVKERTTEIREEKIEKEKETEKKETVIMQKEKNVETRDLASEKDKKEKEDEVEEKDEVNEDSEEKEENDQITEEDNNPRKKNQKPETKEQ